MNIEAPYLDGKGELATPTVLAQIDARTKATMRADLPALAKELKIGGVDGSVPIFPTLAEAQAWEAKNPGKTALTLEPSTPDTTAPTWDATLAVGTPTDKQVVVTASALATDDRAVTAYEVTYDGALSWASITPEGKNFTLSGVPSTTYGQTRLRAKDAAGNKSAALSVPSYTMAAKPPLQPGDVMTSDAFTLYADGTAVHGKYTDATLGGSPVQYSLSLGATNASVQGGALSFAGRAEVKFTGLTERADKEMKFTLKALSTSSDALFMKLRTRATYTGFIRVNSNGSVETLFQGASIINELPFPAGTVKPGSSITFGVKGDAGYVIVDGVRREIPSLNGHATPAFVIDSGTGTIIDNLVVTAL